MSLWGLNFWGQRGWDRVLLGALAGLECTGIHLFLCSFLGLTSALGLLSQWCLFGECLTSPWFISVSRYTNAAGFQCILHPLLDCRVQEIPEELIEHWVNFPRAQHCVHTERLLSVLEGVTDSEQELRAFGFIFFFFTMLEIESKAYIKWALLPHSYIPSQKVRVC